MRAKYPRVLVVAGSDSGAGAGIQADIKTIMALNGYATTAITALTAQNTLGVHGVHAVPPAFVAQQMHVVLEDIGADSVKTGMLLNVGIIQAVAGVLAEVATIPYVCDPVMLAKGGQPLLEPAAIDALVRQLLPRAALITPNIPEAEYLTNITITDAESRAQAAGVLHAMGAHAVLIKGGHAQGGAQGDTLEDWLYMQNAPAQCFSVARQASNHTHGTGCTLASAIACLLPVLPLAQAVEQAQAYVQRAIASAPELGHGHGPLWHGV